MKRIALLLALLPPAASTTLACNCADDGSYVEISAESMAKKPRIEATGDASPTIECMHRDQQDECDGFWIVPASKGTVSITLHFADGSTASDSVEYLYDGHYPCRGGIRPVRDKVIRL